MQQTTAERDTMRQQLAETVFGGQREKGVDVTLIEILGLAAARVTREKLKGIGANRQRIPAHAKEALRRREVATDVQLVVF